jgi:signal transduction histidine kinase
MSLKAKILLSTSLFMVLVVGLLTLNLSIDAIGRQARERDRQARLVQRLVMDWIREGAGPEGFADWDGLSRKLTSSSLISEWVIVAPRGETLHVFSYSEGTALPLPASEVSRFKESIQGRRVQTFVSSVYIPVETRFGRVYGARFHLASDLEAGGGLGDSLTRIFTIMALGTALLLLNVFIFLNRFVLRPLRELSDASKRISEGDFSRKIPETGTVDEMGQLRQAFNTMTERIDSSRRGLEEEVMESRDKIRNTERRLFQAQRLSTTGTLAAGIAHEINNPLGGLMNAAKAIRSGKLSPEKEAEYLALIEEGLDRIHVIVEKVLQFRPKEVEARPVDLREVVNRALAFCDHRMKQKSVTGENLLEADTPLVKGDPLELQQVFLNLLMNGVDACSEGDGRVEISGRVYDDYVKVTFSDNGKGMEEEELVRCMDIFYTTKEVGEGSGLGLSVAHKIIENHGGKLDLESRVGEGTSVHIILPILPESRMDS